VSNAELGDAIYYEMFETLFGKEDRQLELRTDLRYAIDVAPFAGDDRNGDRLAGGYFRVTTRIAYTKTIRNHIFMIGCALDNEQLAALFEDRDCEYRWLVNRGDGLVVERDFRIGRVCIDGQDVPVLDARQTERGYEFWCGGEELKKKLNRPVRVEIDIVTRKSKLNNIFTVYLVYPTRGVDIIFNYEGTKFRNVREVSFFAGRHPSPEVTREPGKSMRLAVGSQDWIFPTSGVAFIWDV
jgi:alanine racemase